MGIIYQKDKRKFLAGTASTTFLEDSFLPQWKKGLTA